MRRRSAAAVMMLALSLSFSGSLIAGATEGKRDDQLIFSVKEARAYSYKASVSEQVLTLYQSVSQLLGEAQGGGSCDPETDPYRCGAGYEQRPNCPKDLAIGPRGPLPQPRPAPGSDLSSGSSGDRHDGTFSSGAPPQSSPFRVNENVAIGHIGNFTSFLETGGLASEGWVDLSGHLDVKAHSATDAFHGSSYEERCHREEERRRYDKGYVHVLSRSTKTPSTYHLSECVRDACDFGSDDLAGIGSPTSTGIEAEKATSIVTLEHRNDEVGGRLSSALRELSGPGGVWSIDSLTTYVRFASDGTRDGLRWQASTIASGVEIAGVPVNLPPGDSMGGQGFKIGIARPYVEATDDGTRLTIVAPGLFVASNQQTVFFAGAELYAGMGRGPASHSTAFTPAEPESGATELRGDIMGRVAEPPREPAATGTQRVSATPAVAVEDPVAIERFVTRIWMVLLLGTGGIGALLIFLQWGRRIPSLEPMYQSLPFRLLDRAHRTFLKT